MRPIISDMEFKERTRRAQKLMQEADTDILLAYGNEAEPQFVRYFSDYWPSFESAGVVIAKEGDPVLLIGPESGVFAADRSRIRDIRRLAAFRESSNPEYPGVRLDTFADVIASLCPHSLKKVAIAGYSLLPHTTYMELTAPLSALGSVCVINGDDIAMRMRKIKSAAEIECMRHAGQITARTFDYILQNIRPGMTEQQVRGLALFKMHELGAENEAFPMWMLSGAGSDQAISRARHKKIESNEILQLQIGARYEGYASSIGRPVFFGIPDVSLKTSIEVAYSAQDAVCAQLHHGNNAKNVAEAYYTHMEQHGLSDRLLYGPCHASGLMEGEPPWIESDSDYPLFEDMTYCVDIFIQNGDGRGFRVEDSVRVGRTCAENMTSYPKKLFIL